MDSEAPKEGNGDNVVPTGILDGSNPSLFNPPHGVDAQEWRTHVEQAIERSKRNERKKRWELLIKRVEEEWQRSLGIDGAQPTDINDEHVPEEDLAQDPDELEEDLEALEEYDMEQDEDEAEEDDEAENEEEVDEAEEAEKDEEVNEAEEAQESGKKPE